MEALALVADLALRIPFVMDVDDEREAQGALDDLSDAARYYGKSKWTSPTNTPDPVCKLVLRAAARHMKNYEGYVLSRAGDETVQFHDRGEGMGSAEFTAIEIAQLRDYGGNQRSGIHSVNTFQANRRPRPCAEGLVPTSSGAYLPYFSSDRDPW